MPTCGKFIRLPQLIRHGKMLQKQNKARFSNRVVEVLKQSHLNKKTRTKTKFTLSNHSQPTTQTQTPKHKHPHKTRPQNYTLWNNLK
jgi:hypothetical protein